MTSSDGRRLLFAFAIAIIVHELFAALFPSPTPRGAVQQMAIARVTIARITPAPPPTPAPRPSQRRARFVAPAATPAIAPARSAPSVHAGAARPKPPAFSHARPIWDLPVGAQGAGAGIGAGAGSTGNGSGAGAGGAQPCGYVEFANPHGVRDDPSTGGAWVDVEMTVHFPDGHAEMLSLDYPWHYASAAANPWSPQNLDDPNFPTRFQFPPADKRASEPPLVQYVIAHSSSDGRTFLKACP